MRNCNMRIRALGVTCVLVLTSMVSAYGGDRDQDATEKRIREREAFLIRKIVEGSKLERTELSELTGGLSLLNDYEKGIRLLENLKKDSRYREDLDEVYFSLAFFYFEKAHVASDERQKEGVRQRAAQYLSDGFASTHDKAMALYKRAKVYSALHCFEKAIADSRDAIRAASTQKLVDFGSGVLLASKQFIEILTKDIAEYETLPDNCRAR